MASGLEAELARVFGGAEDGALAGPAAHQFVTGHALYRAEAWLSQREFPEAWKGALVSASGVHACVARVGADVARRESFLERWVGRHNGNVPALIDTTSASSHSPSLDLAEWGYNTDANVLDELGKAKPLVTRKGTRILLKVSNKQRELLAALKAPELAWQSCPRDHRSAGDQATGKHPQRSVTTPTSRFAKDSGSTCFIPIQAIRPTSLFKLFRASTIG